MEEIECMNEYLLVQEIKEETSGVYYGEVKNKPTKAKILAFSSECKNKKFVVGKTVHLTKYEKIPYDEENNIFYVNEKAVLAQF